jgi:hypothetical protein
VLAEYRSGRVAGHRVHEQEGRHGHAEHDEQRERQAASEV